jgi:hypothetical protein
MRPKLSHRYRILVAAALVLIPNLARSQYGGPCVYKDSGLDIYLTCAATCSGPGGTDVLSQGWNDSSVIKGRTASDVSDSAHFVRMSSRFTKKLRTTINPPTPYNDMPPLNTPLCPHCVQRYAASRETGTPSCFGEGQVLKCCVHGDTLCKLVYTPENIRRAQTPPQLSQIIDFT